MSSSDYLFIKLKRVDRIYRVGEKIQGVVAIDRASSLRHEGITLKLEGQVSPRN